jgi:hypothetical protein
MNRKLKKKREVGERGNLGTASKYQEVGVNYETYHIYKKGLGFEGNEKWGSCIPCADNLTDKESLRCFARLIRD